MRFVGRAAPPTLRPTRGLKQFRWIASILAVVAVCFSTVAISPRPSGATAISSDRAKATLLLHQVDTINGQVGRLGQKYDAAQIKLNQIRNVISNTKTVVAGIERNVAKRNVQLRSDAIFAYVTNGAAASNNPLFTTNASNVGAASVYNQLAAGNVSSTIASLKNYQIKLTQERSLLATEDAQAADATRSAAKTFHSAMLLQAGLKNALAQVKGQIATFYAQAQAAAAAQAAATLASAQAATAAASAPATSGTVATGAAAAGITPPPPDSRANIAVGAAESYLGVWYRWGGASRSGVDCSGLVMLAYQAAGIYLPHYSGAQFNDTLPVPLADIQPGDLLFWGYNGGDHVAMYVGNGQMIEAPYTGAQVHITPLRFGYGFAGIGRPRG